MRQNLTDWQAAERIADQPEVHEALEAFSHCSTDGNAVGVVLAVMKAVGCEDAKRYRWLRANAQSEEGSGGKFNLREFGTLSFTWTKYTWIDGKPVLTCGLDEAIDKLRGARVPETPPWDDCKVAFGFTCDPDEVWNELSPDVLPQGWRLVETDGAGARYVALFRVNGAVLPEDGRAVAALLRQLEQGETL